MEELSVKNLVRWTPPGGETLGVVTGVSGNRIRVRLDDGEERIFVWPSEVLERVVLPQGQHVRVLASGATGVISAIRPHNGVVLYQINLPGGQAPTVLEDGVRPAAITDPIERLRAGQLDSARATNLRLAATRLLYAYQHDELSTLGNSRVEIKPHQVGVVHRVAEAYPHRYILADEVGLGKTIEAGLLIRELLARSVVGRVLILAPSGLVGQWQQELKTKFNLSFAIYNRETLGFLRNRHASENPWTLENLVLCSTSYAAYDEQRQKDIATAGWDMVVIDEAHHARRTNQGGNRVSATRLYRLAERISDPDLTRAQAMLLLTATPMQLDPFELYSLIELLDPAVFPTPQDFDRHRAELRGLNATVERIKCLETITATERDEALDAAERWLGYERPELEALVRDKRSDVIDELQAQHRLSQVMVRNRKRVVGGFMPRVAAVWEVDLTEQEHAAYWAMTEYLRTGYARSRADSNNALGFLMATFQKLNASSSHALRGSLLRRIEKLEAVTDTERTAQILEDVELEEMPTATALDDLLSQRLDQDWEEVRDLERIVGLLEAIEIDSKALKLRENLQQIAERDPDAKVIIFTQFRDTQDFLADVIGQPWTINVFHGQLKPQDKDAAVARFRDGKGPQLLISTEAGGEGRNFQFCDILVNYDLPWNPMKVEQRIGRIDRIGQKKPVKIFNFSTNGTIEERVLEVLTNRIGVFKETIGGLDPILGEVEQDLRKIFLLAETESRREFAALERRLESRVAEARAAEERLADLIMDTRSYRKEEVERLLERPRLVSPHHVKAFVLGALSVLGVRIDPDDEHDGVFRLRLSSAFEHHFPDEVRAARERRVTFDLAVALEREEVEFMAFGHPIVDKLVALAREGEIGGITSLRTVLTDEVAPARGWFVVYELELQGLNAMRELHPVFVHADGRADGALAGWLMDRAMSGRREDFGASRPLPGDDAGLETAVSIAEADAVTTLLDRQQEAEAANSRLLTSERVKRERFYDYRSQAAQDKFDATTRVLERLRQSTEDDERRIIPVWEKRAETDSRMIEAVEQERTSRLAELDSSDHVIAQHQLLSASFVSIEPDPEPLFEQIQVTVSASMFEQFKRQCGHVEATDVAARRPALLKRRKQLILLAQKHAFNVTLATTVADVLLALTERIESYSSSELPLINGAIGYFLELEDEAHDLKDPNGFDDDAQIARSVLEVLGRADLAAQIDARLAQ